MREERTGGEMGDTGVWRGRGDREVAVAERAMD